VVFPLLAIQKYAQATGPLLLLPHQANGSRFRPELSAELRARSLDTREPVEPLKHPKDFCVSPMCKSPEYFPRIRILPYPETIQET